MQGNELLQTTKTLNAATSTALFLRHAERYELTDYRTSFAVELTPNGKQMAERFGNQLPVNKPVRLFHSPLKRCRQTAEGIARGATAAGLAVEFVGEQPILGVGFILDEAKTEKLAMHYGLDFIRAWFSGQIGSDVIKPPRQIAQEYLEYLAARLSEDALPGRLDIHVSHDWNTMVLRELMLGIRHEEAGWLDYLDGLAIQMEHNGLQVFYREHTASQATPWVFRV